MGSVLLTLVLLNIGVAVDLTWVPSTDEVLKFVTPNTASRDSYISGTKKLTTTDQLIKKAGFQSNVHKVVTEDGYILRLTRIKTLQQGPPVLIVHGLFEASDTWLQRGRKEDLAFILADSGFDVWLADLRGNVFSRKHLSLKDYQREFWDFSFHEMAIYDLPAIITEILSNSLYPKIFYVGHSMGTTVLPTLTSIRPEYNKYIQTAVLLSPIVFGVKDMKSKIVRQLFKQSDSLMNIFNKARVYNLLPRNNITGALIRVSCSKPVQEICLNLVGDINGENRKNLNKDKVVDYLNSITSGASTKTLNHYAQQFKSDEFKQFDYGEIKNLQVYGQPTPPHYNLNLVTVPIVLFYSNNDYLLDEKSMQRLARSLPNVIYMEALPKYSHLDYLFGNDAPKILYSKIVDIFYEKYSS